MNGPVLVLIHGRRSLVIDVDLEKIDLARPIAQRSLAHKVAGGMKRLSMRRGLTRRCDDGE